MTTTTQHLVDLWRESRSRLEQQIDDLTPADLKKRLAPSPNSAGFILQHIAEVELLFAKNVFKAPDIKIIAHTVIDKMDSGQWIDLEQIKNLVHQSGISLSNILNTQNNEDWEQEIRTKEFGVKTKAEALGRITSHTAYHAGQLALILKYGRSN